MNRSLIVTLIGPDRPGLVSAVAACAEGAGANWMESRMAQLAGQFAGIVRLEVDSDAVLPLEAALRGLEAEGLHLTIEHGREVVEPSIEPSIRRVQLSLTGHDHPGIVRDISGVLLRYGISIDGLETGCEPAPMSGEPVFRAEADLAVPASADLHALQDDLEALANELMVDLELHDAAPAEPPNRSNAATGR
ncbi:glycine cleavage system protein R [Thioalkalivibrio paradoxus]|uniref:Glycine cleavage system transcriptional repressor n=1 Tax=Thioalkalivibrio paradoxus ARh 1 TaxID=713585 RepID=W0DIX6_9GAMM|nr:ACT domain-containing protein [Thioalkalivibrio paradoxus]AHE98564.1 glycine cleavage system protein R [Thioalkalivibrio paradoxus ARh 1]